MTPQQHPRARTCTRCDGGGFVNVKNGNVKCCPFCNPMTTPQPIDWGYCFIAGVALAMLLLGSVVGHWWISAGVGG